MCESEIVTEWSMSSLLHEICSVIHGFSLALDSTRHNWWFHTVESPIWRLCLDFFYINIYSGSFYTSMFPCGFSSGKVNIIKSWTLLCCPSYLIFLVSLYFYIICFPLVEGSSPAVTSWWRISVVLCISMLTPSHKGIYAIFDFDLTHHDVSSSFIHLYVKFIISSFDRCKIKETHHIFIIYSTFKGHVGSFLNLS